MTNLRTFGSLTLVLTRSWSAGGAWKLTLSKMVCVMFFLCFVAAGAPSQTVTTLFNFDQALTGYGPYGSLVQGIDGQLYGITTQGHAVYYCGTVFKINTSGHLTTAVQFSYDTAPDFGCQPDGGLMLATGGDIYGSTSTSWYNSESENSSGALFRVKPAGTFTIVHQFNYTDGANTNSALVEGANGIFYGTTVNGGKPIGCCDGGGVLFKMTPAGFYTALHFFDFTDGWDPQDATLIQATDGRFYGETAGGGPSAVLLPLPVAAQSFELARTEAVSEPLRCCIILMRRTGSPLGGVIEASDGNFYGTTYYGGQYGDGTVFKLTPSGVFTALHSFDGSDGAQPRGRLIQATDGNLYGTTYAGGPQGYGTIFQITPAGKLTTLFSFTFNSSEGASLYGEQPMTGLVQDTNGTFYGTTSTGGPGYEPLGTIFSLSMGLDPFVAFVRGLGVVGQTVEILGQGFTGTTGVSFNGTAAKFTVVSDTYLTATVPAGAASGYVTVAMPSGTLTSNKTFRVLPQIVSFTPSNGPVGTSAVITGKSFTGAIHVHFGSVEVTNFTVDSDTQITATVPAGATAGEISVCTVGGSAYSTTSFKVTN